MLSPEDPAGTPRSEAAAASRAATLAHHRTRRYGDISRPPHVEPVAYPRGWFVYRLTAKFSKKYYLSVYWREVAFPLSFHPL
jgi:hypothetical protein